MRRAKVPIRRALFLAFLWVVFLLPAAVLLLYGFSGRWEYPRVLPDFLSLRGFSLLSAQGGRIGISLLSSAGYSLSAVVLTLLLSYFPAAALARSSFRGKDLVEAALILPAVLPSITYAVGAHVVFIRLSLDDRWIGVVLILALFGYPYMLRSLQAGFTALGEDFSLCAENLGAGPLRRIFRVELPLLLPAVFAGGLVVFLVAFTEYFLVFLIGGGAVPSITGYLVPYLLGSDYQVSSLIVLVFFFVPVVLFLVLDLIVGKVYEKRGLRV